MQSLLFRLTLKTVRLVLKLSNKKNRAVSVIIVAAVIIALTVSLVILIKNNPFSAKPESDDKTSSITEASVVFKTGSYKNDKTAIVFDEERFTVENTDTFVYSGTYEIDNYTLICHVKEYVFKGPEGNNNHTIADSEKWDIVLDISDNSTLKVKSVNIPDSETEAVITLYNLFQTDYTFSLQ